jgi:hypothetical protein
VKFVAGTETVTVPLELKGTIAGPDQWWRLTHPPGSRQESGSRKEAGSQK